MKNEESVEVKDKKGIQDVVLQYFRSIFGSIHPTIDAMEEVLESVDRRVTDAMNEVLMLPFSSKEVIYALKQMHPLKSQDQTPFLDSLISPSQFAFVPGRLITDNVLVAYELNHFLKHKNRGKDGYVSLKLDVNKAYDRVELCFLDRVLGRLGFNERFVSLIMSCVSSVTFSFLLNGEQFGFLHSERGLRQGDPLSPYLFLLCAEAFSGMIRKAESNGFIQGIAVSRAAPLIFHLLFVDDTLIFCKATPEAMLCLKSILDAFQKASGLKINLHKSAMVVNNNVAAELRVELAGILGVSS
ncbi:UNVERIFIED_CONTAM: putative mitochondrial protein [Sesamum latifolium]|uniref:Mitochondrial protein n=1 Tax=Sesamum latifolium TaxID=2727402 RepID=A0AAW2VWG5_9LAMI